MSIFRPNTLKLKRGVLLAMIIFVMITVISATITVFDPTAEWDQEIMSVLWLAGLTLAVIAMFSHSAVISRREWGIVFVAWVVRVLYATLNNAEIITFRGDNFFDMAWGLYYGFNHIINGTYPVITNYPHVLLAEFRIFGINRLVTCYVNAFLTMIAIYFMLKCFSILEIDRKISTILLIVFSFNPFSILFGSEVFREAVYLPMAAISLYFFIKWTKKYHAIYMLIAIIAVLPMIYLHSGYIFIVPAYVVVAFFHFRHITGKRLIYKMILTLGVVVAAVVFVVFYSYISVKYLTKLSMIGNYGGFADYFDMVQGRINSDSGSQYLKWMASPSSIWEMVLYTPIRMFYFLCSPMIWDCYRAQDIISFVADSIVFLTAFVVVIKFLIDRKKWRVNNFENYKLVLIGAMIVIVLVAVPFAWGTYNAGTALRHRNCLLPYVCVQIGICYTMMRDRKVRCHLRSMYG